MKLKITHREIAEALAWTLIEILLPIVVVLAFEHFWRMPELNTPKPIVIDTREMSLKESMECKREQFESGYVMPARAHEAPITRMGERGSTVKPPSTGRERARHIRVTL